MEENQQVEMLGLASAVGRLGWALKQTERALAEAQRKIADLEAKERDGVAQDG